MNSPVKLGAHDRPVTRGRMTMCEEMGASHAFLEQPGKVRLLLRGQCLADLVEEGGRALGTRLGEQTKRGSTGPWIELEIRANGQEAVLADWLNRLLYLARRDRWAPVECEVMELSDSRLRARVRGVPLPERPCLERAVIRSSSLVAPGGRGLQADVILEAPRAASRHRPSPLKAAVGMKGRG